MGRRLIRDRGRSGYRSVILWAACGQALEVSRFYGVMARLAMCKAWGFLAQEPIPSRSCFRSLHRVRRLRRNAVTTLAVAVPAPVPADKSPSGSSGWVHIQYTLTDGRVIKRIARSQSTKGIPLLPGQKVLVWYDPHDPGDVLVYGRWGGRLTGHSLPRARCSFSLVQASPCSAAERPESQPPWHLSLLAARTDSRHE